MTDAAAPKQINGFRIQSALKLAKLVSETAYANFTKNLTQFESDAQKEDLDALYKAFVDAETKVARLATIQDVFNITIKVSALGQEMTLAEVINRVGGAGRATKLWRLANSGTAESNRYSRLAMSAEVVRDKDKEYAVRAKPQAHCVARYQEAEKIAASLREAISVGNTKTIPIVDNDGLFD